MEGTWLQIWHPSQSCRQVIKTGILPFRLENLFSSDGTLVASVHPLRRDVIEIWSTDDGAVLHNLDANSGKVYSVAWSSNGTTLACFTYDFKTRLWDAATGTCFATIAEFDSMSGLRFSADNALIACKLQTGIFKVFGSGNGEGVLPNPYAKSAILLDMQFSENNELLAVVKDDTADRLEVWNISTGQRLGNCHCADPAGLVDNRSLDARISPQNSTVITSRYQVWNYRNHEITHGPRPSDDRRVWLTGQGENLTGIAHRKTSKLAILELAEGASRVLHRHQIEDPIVVCSRTGLIAYTQPRVIDILVHVYDTQRSRHFSLRYCGVSLVRFASDGITFVIFQPRGNVYSYNIHGQMESGAVNDPRGADEDPKELYPSHTAKIVAIVYESHHVRIWNMGKENCITTLTGHDDWVRRPSFLEDHNLVAAISADNTVRVWKTDSSDLVACFPFEKTLYRVSIADNGLSVIVNDGWSDVTLLFADGVPFNSTFYWISVDESWIMWKQYKIVYFPPEYRSAYKKRSCIIYENTVTLTSDTGHVLFLQLDPNLDPLEWTFEDPLMRNPGLWTREDRLADVLDF
ncbi:WD40-repeat-containing domain protein [Aspergillus multicolor]|uniref:WD40 repeat domain-containing protein n=1 Tax=Aspergillus multicolor TaxID=41759 RepID=UPI003CCD6009